MTSVSEELSQLVLPVDLSILDFLLRSIGVGKHFIGRNPVWYKGNKIKLGKRKVRK